MKKILPFFLLLIIAFACDKEDDPNPSPADKEAFIKDRIFNGSSKWIITSMKADKEREIGGAKSSDWLSLMPACRTDNVYLFGEIGVSVTSIAVDENDKTCSDAELDYVDQGLFLNFSSDFSKAQVDVEGEAMQKLFNVEDDGYLEYSSFTHTWEFQEVSESKVKINAIIIPDESAGMVAEKANVTIVFERTN